MNHVREGGRYRRERAAELTLFEDVGFAFPSGIEGTTLRYHEISFGMTTILAALDGVVDETRLWIIRDALSAAFDGESDSDSVWQLSLQPGVMFLFSATSRREGFDSPLPAFLCQSRGPTLGDWAPSVHRLALIGDDATTRDLQISTLAGSDGYDMVTTRYSELLLSAGSDALFQGVEYAYVVGPVNATGGICLSNPDAEFDWIDLAGSIDVEETGFVALLGPVPATAVPVLVKELASRLALGLLVRVGPGDEDRSFALHFFRQLRRVNHRKDVLIAYSDAVDSALDAGVERAAIDCYRLIVRD
jgi:hypothetical protein